MGLGIFCEILVGIIGETEGGELMAAIYVWREVRKMKNIGGLGLGEVGMVAEETWWHRFGLGWEDMWGDQGRWHFKVL